MTFAWSTLLGWLRPINKMVTRFAKLESRISDLEKAMEKRSELQCPGCGGWQYFVKSSEPWYSKDNGVTNTAPHRLLEYGHTMLCKDCGYTRIVRERTTPTL